MIILELSRNLEHYRTYFFIEKLKFFCPRIIKCCEIYETSKGASMGLQVETIRSRCIYPSRIIHNFLLLFSIKYCLNTIFEIEVGFKSY